VKDDLDAIAGRNVTGSRKPLGIFGYSRAGSAICRWLDRILAATGFGGSNYDV